jgi:hypothetical protein
MSHLEGSQLPNSNAPRARGEVSRRIIRPVYSRRIPARRLARASGAFAEFETNLRRERQLEEIANAKVRGVYRAARRVLILPKIKRIKTGGMGPPEREKFRFGTHYFRSGMPWGRGKIGGISMLISRWVR